MKRFFLIIGLMTGIYLGGIFGLRELNLPDIHYLIIGFLLLLVALCDHALTYKCLKSGAKEKNPIANALFKLVGFKFGSFLILLFFIVMIIWKFDELPIYAQVALILAYAIVPVNNFIVLKKRKKINAKKNIC